MIVREVADFELLVVLDVLARLVHHYLALDQSLLHQRCTSRRFVRLSNSRVVRVEARIAAKELGRSRDHSRRVFRSSNL